MKIISINIERDLHSDRTIPFLKNEKPDIVCVQEIFEDMVSFYERELDMNSVFKPMGYVDSSEDCLINKGIRTLGIAIFAKEIKAFKVEYIFGEENDLKMNMMSNDINKRNTLNILVMWAKIGVLDKEYNIANTHFTWTDKGVSFDFQIEDAKKLINILDSNLNEFIFVGDTNAPRGNKTFTMFAEAFKDNIPEEYKTSIDQNLHRVRGIQHMVDCFFTKGDIKVKNVKLVDGVSDHMAVVGEVY